MVEKDVEKKGKKKLSKKEMQNRQVMWAVVLMASIILIILLVPFVTTNFINKFIYLNLDFQKTKLGEIIFYSTRVPIANIHGQVISSYSMNFRDDPRELEHIEVDIPNNLITFKTAPVFITLNPEMEACEDNTIALINFAGFLRNFAEKDVKSAVSDENYANSSELPYVTCENSPDNTVIHINSGSKTEITKVDHNCYELTYSNCEIIPVTERFMLLVLEKYMSYFLRG